jgi:hypothetical protein
MSWVFEPVTCGVVENALSRSHETILGPEKEASKQRRILSAMCTALASNSGQIDVLTSSSCTDASRGSQKSILCC